MTNVDNNPYSAPSEDLEGPPLAPLTHAEIKRKVIRESLLVFVLPLVILVALLVLGFIL